MTGPMLDRAAVAAWLEAYVRAWETYDPAAIGDLFTEDAAYDADPFDDGIRGRDAIVAEWLTDRDAPGTYRAAYQPVAVDGETAVATGMSRYFEADGTTPRTAFGNVFVLRFAPDGRCAEYREWYMERAKDDG
jgi:ketosteroid isomerase-like protein